MPVNIGLAQLSDHFLLSTVFLYALAMLAFAGDFAYGRVTARPGVTARPRPGVSAARAGTAGQGRAATPVGVPAGVTTGSAGLAGSATDAGLPGGGPGVGLQDAGVGLPGAGEGLPGAGDGLPGGGAGVGLPGGGAGGLPGSGGAGAVPAGRWRAGSGRAGPWVRAAIALTVLGLVAHLLGILTRGLAEHRIPWGNMYEFVTAITCAAVLAFLVVIARYRTYSIGLFVMAPVVLGLGLCATVLYTAVGPLVPALHSYWIAIHVTAMIVAIGSYIVAAVLTTLYLLADRHARRFGEDSGAGVGAILQRLPSRQSLDRLSYRTVVFAFPVWTFAIIAGAIWADQAWGRYWGWDPKETWSFITWVVYAGYLHARATAGWRGRRAAYVQLAAFACLIFNLVGVNLWITGLHSYAGIH